MSDIAIRVENLGKKYIIGHQKSGSLRESFVGKMKNMFSPIQTEKEEFWALKDINFEIKKGEAVGIIGRNGAGKSTLLKILSRITDPTTGGFEINGRVSSLLEVGTGFHPELSGRENIYLNGTILGMKRVEIKAKFDEIIAFSGVEKFIDTPVKHYSSGMKVRLAFSVAAHLEPEILIVDEVLAVGDAEFQKKCLGKMDEVSKNEGRTVLFVSHNMGAIEALCTRGVLLKDGGIEFIGETSKVVYKYLNDINEVIQSSIWIKKERDKQIPLEITKISTSVNTIQSGLSLEVQTELISNTNHAPAFIAYNILSEDGVPIFQSIPSDKGFIEPVISGQLKKGVINLPLLIPGSYRLSVWVGPHYSETYCWEKEKVTFDIERSPITGRIQPHSKKNGYLVSDSFIINQ